MTVPHVDQSGHLRDARSLLPQVIRNLQGAVAHLHAAGDEQARDDLNAALGKVNAVLWHLDPAVDEKQGS